VNSPSVVIDSLVVVAPIVLTVVPTSRSDSTVVGTTVPLPDSADVVLTGSNAGAASWTATHGAATWLTITTGAGTGSGVMRWERDPSSLTVGVYTDTVTVTAAGADGSPAILVDSLVVLPPLTLALTPTVRLDTATAGDTVPRPDSAFVELTGAGNATAAWSAAHGSAAWVTLTLAAGVGSGTTRWTRKPAGLSPGWYVDTVTVTSAGALGSPAMLVDSLLVQPGPAAIALVPEGTRDSISIGDTSPLADSASVELTGAVADTTQWTAAHGGSPWLTLTTAAGTGPGTVRWQRSATGLPLGRFVDTITVATSSARTAMLIDTVEIIPPPLTLSASSRRGTATAGSIGTEADSIRLTLRGVGNTVATWTATHGGGSWLALTAAAGTGDGTVRWTRDPAGLRPGFYVDTVTMTTSRNDVGVVVDTLTLTAPTVVVDCAARELLGTACLNDVRRRYLDLDGNADGTYNLGDLIAQLQRSAAAVAGGRRP
jgi:hypothetical protein